MKSFTVLAALASLGAVSAQTNNCPAPGSTSAAGDYSCNPAHAYPEGQQCVLVNGCYFLRSKAASSTAAQPSATGCPAPGATSAAGDYSCNPAHAYPEGQECILVNGCFFLRNKAAASAAAPMAAASEPTGTSCPAPGSTSAVGDISCLPTQKYSEGLECVLVNGCYLLRPMCSTSSTAAPKPTTTSCPAPGSTNAAGEYSCNPAHKYPEGQQCVLMDGCYLLRTTGGVPTTHPNTTVPATSTKPVVLPTNTVTAGAGALSASRLSAVAGLVAAGFYLLL
ncbi:hypothetical protein VD0002_g7927 [Verticillium dahliae]|nr:Gamma-taxilin [Verticillium dahliae VDG2]KAH6697875.1 hypothetical protein EV126DRAFT_426239 [Verticillium dahliae]PNH36076.1 hypothetical protein BJF96_g671 [Verticillium dahliae]PNH47809.1 hypothetical protein VD0003_g8732 [Verticillium dahliae]PNH59628.1 hypothetical protein VD0002_g7927 [Verticillium dahliae]